MTSLTIGAVLRELQQEFPDLTVSKIRFLESEGLVLPRRRESGQRAFTPEDVERLRFVLRAQRDRFWPLKVIRQALDRIDTGIDPGYDSEDAEPPGSGPDPAGGEPAQRSSARGRSSQNESTQAPATQGQFSQVQSTQVQSTQGQSTQGTGAGGPEQPQSAGAARLPTAAQLRRRRTIRVTPQELREHTGLDVAAYTTLKAYGLIRTDTGGRHGADDLDVARECAALAAYGLEPRHLRLFRVAADREIGLARQILEPERRRRARGAVDADPEQLETEIVARTLALHVALVRAGLGQTP